MCGQPEDSGPANWQCTVNWQWDGIEKQGIWATLFFCLAGTQKYFTSESEGNV